MRKVLVDREMLERIARDDEGAASFADFEELKRVLAQPAEAEGVDFGFDDRSVKVSQEAYSIFLARERHHLAALSAVTAERDRLQSELDALSWEIASPNISYALRDQLLGQLAGDHEPEEILCVEDFYSWLANAIDNIRAEHRKAEGGQPVRVFASAAMAAKEA